TRKSVTAVADTGVDRRRGSTAADRPGADELYAAGQIFPLLAADTGKLGHLCQGRRPAALSGHPAAFYRHFIRHHHLRGADRLSRRLLSRLPRTAREIHDADDHHAAVLDQLSAAGILVEGDPGL